MEPQVKEVDEVKQEKQAEAETKTEQAVVSQEKKLTDAVELVKKSIELLGFKYPECQKGGYHIGQALNLVCTDPKCIDKCVICCLCYDEEHRGHKVRPLKLIIERSKKYLSDITPLSLDATKLKDSITTSESQLMKKFGVFQSKVLSNLDTIKNSIKASHVKMMQQVDLKTGSNKQMIDILNSISSVTIQTDVFVQSMRKLITGMPPENEKEQDTGEVSQDQIQKTINNLKVRLETEFDRKTEAILADLSKYLQLLQKTSENPCIFGGKIEFKFSPEMHHTGVSVVSQTLIKSTEGYSYRFALMEPTLYEKGNKPQSVAYKIKENGSNWLAVGICYKNVVVQNNYNFEYSNLGHGAYMISSNGGSWSSTNSAFNNVVTSFSFYKDDVIIVNYDPTTSKVTFRKKDTEEKHVIEFEARPDDELHLCGLFYYNNDEIEYLGPSDMM